ncbi:DUF5348 domain-containing protein [Romboutsia timonensis]|uniref:DUF5348 domain-containing protein n=1 Tax=Romboutsia timonensis TaxID=1776391 RepID=UPI002A7505DE|nr:DUF5348 domain-containing protein [Romboutsia timonensis]MDY3001917.1 DUF5348 domain-containing protein [Romboutsia timonensis]MDY3960095.1 DUF5348 domain-containing protein [Romboutsia timonensis]
MNKYEIESKIRNLRLYLEGIVNNEKAETWEDEKIKNSIDSLADRLYDYEQTMKYYSKKPQESRLTLNSSGRYEVNDIELTCGHGLEMYLYDSYEECEIWCEGRVEADNGEYYFLNLDGANKELEEGDLVRVRI